MVVEIYKRKNKDEYSIGIADFNIVSVDRNLLQIYLTSKVVKELKYSLNKLKPRFMKKICRCGHSEEKHPSGLNDFQCIVKGCYCKNWVWDENEMP